MSDEVTQEMLRKINDLEERVRRLSSERALFPIWNINTPATISANQNNYDPGDYAALLLQSDINGRTITGISGGVAGRLLLLVNISSTTIILANSSASSSTENQILIPGAANLTMQGNPNGNATVVLLGWGLRNVDGWRLLFRSVP